MRKEILERMQQFRNLAIWEERLAFDELAYELTQLAKQTGEDYSEEIKAAREGSDFATEIMQEYGS